ncbi:response regulator [Sulfurimonas sp. SAG-AH-194-C21]|nr:response regulator [Sulfurimonas sp. SAG-AH-194-C21]MDF1883271.1 response regulator [Sulfurimonas sp. SAG-AH-194-C21]
MNILIVDDLRDNREILERLVVQYTRKYNTRCNVYSAADGLKAVDICKVNNIDLIFMDITMPIMDGLEATKIIHKLYPSIMIIVISSENDEDVKNNILNFGAEDYIRKPLSSSIIIQRLHNYDILISSRNTAKSQPQAVNNFTSNIYTYQMKFFIATDDELAQVWETLLLRLDFQNYIEQLSDFVSLIFGLGTFQIEKSYKCNLYIEEDENFFYFSMDNMKKLSAKTVNAMIKKHCKGVTYKQKEDFISFALAKTTQENHSTPSVEIKQIEVLQESLQTYNIMSEDTLNEFEFILAEVNTEIMLMGSSDLEIEDIDTINEYVKKLVTMLSHSSEANVISESLSEFTNLLDEYSEAFLEMSKDLAQMMQSFINDIITWKEMIFYTGAPSVDFLDSSISSNVGMIKALFITHENPSENLDDIFDF